MNKRNINIKILSGILAFIMCFSNFGLLSNGIMKVLAEDEITNNINLETNVEITKYIQYNQNNYKGVLLQTKLEINQEIEEKDYIPTLENSLKIKVPEIEGKLPSVNILAISTVGTDGKDEGEVNFNKSNWNYDTNSGTINIDYRNESNYNKFQKNSKDIFEIIYTYPQESFTGYESAKIAEVNIELNRKYKDEKKELSITKKLQKQFILKDKISDIVSYSINNQNDIYKGYMYVNKDTEYISNECIEISNIDLADEIEIIRDKNTDISYTNTKIKKSDFDKIIGENGKIEIYSEDQKISTIKYDGDEKNKKLINENKTGDKKEITTDDIFIEYENELKDIKLKIINPKEDGRISFENTKKISSSDELKKASSFEDKTTILAKSKIVIESREEMIETCNSEFSNKIELKEPINEVNVELKDNNGNNNGTISTLNENILTYTATLRNDSNKFRLLEDPVVTITFPREISYIKFGNLNILQGNGIKIKSYSSAREKDGTAYIRIQLSGKQTEYTNSITEGVKLTMSFTLGVSSTTPSKATVITTKIENKGVEGSYNSNIKIASKDGLLMLATYEGYSSSSEKTILTDSTLKNNLIADNTESKELKQKIYLINNYSNKISNVKLTGNLGYSDDNNKSSFITQIKEIICKQGGEIEYTTDGKEWSKDFEDIDKINSYRVTISEIEKEQSVEIDTVLIIPEKLNVNEQTFIQNSIEYTVENERKSQTSTVGFFTAKVSDKKEDIVKIDEITSETTEDITPIMKATVGGENISENDKVNKGQIIRYYVGLKNNTNEEKVITLTTNIENAQFYEARNTGIEYNENKFSTAYSLAPENDLQRKVRIVLKAGDSVIYDYQVKVRTDADTVKSSNKIEETSQELSMQNDVYKNAKISLEAKYAYNEEEYVSSDGGRFPVILYASNLTNKNLKNINVEINIPEELNNDLEEIKSTVFGKELLPYETGKVKIENNKLIWTIDEIQVGNMQKLYVSFITKELDKTIAKKDVSIVASTEYKKEKYNSNDLIKTIYQVNDNFTASIKTDIKDDKVLNNGDIITFTISLENKGVLDLENISVNSLPDEGIEFISAESTKTLYKIEDLTVLNLEGIHLQQGEKELITIKAKINVASVIASNTDVICKFDINTEYSSKCLITQFKINNPSDSKDYIYDADKDEEIMDNEGSTDIDNENKKYSIGGLAWFDENKNGVRDENEQLLEGIKVSLINADNKQIATNKDGNQIVATTNSEGEYKFEELEKGNYIVVFEFDNNKYSVTTYKKENIDSRTNSDALSSKVTINGQTKIAAITDIIKLNSNMESIDIGLIQNAKFDLKLDKFISKIIVKNTQGTETKNYENSNFAKVDLVAKYINSASVIITYKFVIKNNADVTGYVDKLTDNLPNGLEFSSELNKDWYQASDGTLHTSLSGIAIEPGKTSEVELVLTKQMNEENTGKITNTASITKISNLEGINEEDDKVIDNTSSADILLSIKTGTPIMYISITMISIGIIAIGAYLIKKKVLNRVI